METYISSSSAIGSFSIATPVSTPFITEYNIAALPKNPVLFDAVFPEFISEKNSSNFGVEEFVDGRVDSNFVVEDFTNGKINSEFNIEEFIPTSVSGNFKKVVFETVPTKGVYSYNSFCDDFERSVSSFQRFFSSKKQSSSNSFSFYDLNSHKGSDLSLSFYSHALLYKKQRKLSEYNTNLKKFVNPLLKVGAKTFVEYMNSKRSFNFNDIGEDLLLKKEFSISNEAEVISLGFQKINYDEYAYAKPQAFKELSPIDSIKYDCFTEFTFADDTYKLSYRDNELFFSLFGEIFISVCYPTGYQILHASVDSNHFVHIFIAINDEIYFYKTHLSYSFYNYDPQNILITNIANTEYVHFLPVEGIDLTKHVFFGSDEVGLYFMDSYKNFHILEFVKKFYFVSDNYIYRNVYDVSTLTDSNSDVVKVEHTYFYDFLSFIGFNDIKDELNLNSYHFEYLKSVNLEFGNHFNGFQNFFELANVCISNPSNLPSSFVSCEDDYFKVSGNLSFNSGSYKLKIKYINDSDCYCYLEEDNIITNSSPIYFNYGFAVCFGLKIYKKFDLPTSIFTSYSFDVVGSDLSMGFIDFNKKDIGDFYNFDSGNAELTMFDEILPSTPLISAELTSSGLKITQADSSFEVLELIGSDGKFTELSNILSEHTYSIVNNVRNEVVSLTLDKNEKKAFTVARSNFTFKLTDFIK